MRCYNGCPDSALQAVIDERKATVEEARCEGILITFFPLEEAWKAFRAEDHESLSGFQDTPRLALIEARERSQKLAGGGGPTATGHRS